ncbi:hypothetical protein ZTR_02290 [Talaromyces verruculosus]|nr:hypothetical protein ZTR_02290 [Talaromyces verruculosus]
MQSAKNEAITSSRPGDHSIPASTTDISEKTVSENDPIHNEPVNADPEQAQPQAQSEVEPFPDGGYGWVCVLCVFLVNAHTWGINSSYGVFLAHYLTENTFPGASDLDFAFVGGLSLSMAQFIAPAATITTREWGTKTTLAIGIVLQTAALLGASWSTKIWQLFLSQGVCFGFGMGMQFSATVGIIPQWFTRRRSLANGIATAGSGIGGLIYSLATDALIQRWGTGWAFRVLAIVSAAASGFCAIIVRDRNKAIGAIQIAFHFELLKRPEFLLTLAWGCFSVLGYVLLLFSLPSYADTVGLTASQGSILGAMFNLGGGLGRPVIGYVSDSFGRINTALVSTFLAGLFSFVIWVFAKSFGVLIFYGLIGGAVSATYTTTVAPTGADGDPGKQEAGIKDNGAVMARTSTTYLIMSTPIWPIFPTVRHDRLAYPPEILLSIKMAQQQEFRTTQRPPLDLSHHFSQTTKNRLSSNVKGLYKWFQIPGMQNVAGGLPHESYFPYDTLEAAAARPSRFDEPKSSRGKSSKPAEWHVTVPKIQDTTDILQKIDLSTALQYGTAEGYPPLAAFIRKFARDHLHPNVPYAEGPEIIMTCGSTDGLAKAVEALTNPWNKTKDWIRDKEGVLFEEFAYMNAVQTVEPRGLNVVTVGVDADGMRASGPGGLADVLENWDFSNGKRPHLMYTVTLGQNPTGSTTSIERRKEIYTLCQKYDIIIIEDEPYWNLQFPSSRKHAAKYRGEAAVQADLFNRNYNAHGRSSGYEFLDSLVPSFLSIDVDGRVVRLDTFSKTIAPGCRLGWITAQPAIVERIARITEVSTQQPSGFVQVMVAQLLLQQQGSPATARKSADKEGLGWTLDGWVQWLAGLRDAYERRVHDMCSALEEGRTVAIDRPAAHRRSNSLDSWSVINKVPMYEFDWPLAGMFLWVKIRYDTHPLLEIYGAEKVCTALWFFLLKKPFLILSAPGTMFAPTEAIRRGLAFQYIRLCFAPMAEEAVTDISQHFVAGCRAFWQLENFDDIEELDDSVVPEMMGLQMC